MAEMVVKSSSHSYQITVGTKLRFRLEQYISQEYSTILIVTDEKIAQLYLNDVKENFSDKNMFTSIIPVGEKTKHIDYFYQLHTEAIQYGLDRDSLIIALGGGVVGDLAGFVAATFMRGIDYIQMPTTILAHDSSVGGKVAINHELGKNLIGNFYPPKAVIYDVDTLKSLSEQEIRSGYAELVKEALISDETFYHKIIETNLNKLTDKQLEDSLLQGMKVKAFIVEKDENESGERKFLNLGHTLGHALEANLGYGMLTHGEAVAIGLLFAIHVSQDIFNPHLPYAGLLKWLEENNYPLDTDLFDEEKLLTKMKSDKKAKNKTIQMVLLNEIGKPITQELEDQAIRDYLKSFKKRLVKE